MDRTEPYRVLGLDTQCDGDELKAAYRYLSKKYHPDRSSAPDAGVRFGKVVKAYKVLNVELKKERMMNARVRSTSEILSQSDDIFALGSLALTANDAGLRRSAVRRLGFSGKKAAYLFLRRALSDRDDSVTAAAVRAVADLSAYQASTEIAALWARASERVRRAVLDAAEATGEPLFRPALELAGHGSGVDALRARRILRDAAMSRARS